MKSLFLLIFSNIIGSMTKIITMIIKQIKKITVLFEKSVEIPIMKFIVDFFTRKLEKKTQKEFSASEWKSKALDDFKLWLANTDSDDTAGSDDAAGSFKLSVTPDTCDFFTLFSEFVSLKQEIKMQNREQHRAVKTLQSFTEDYKKTYDTFKKSTRDIAELEYRIRLNCENKAASGFFDVRDALLRGYKAGLEAKKWKKFFMCRHENIENISKGYEIAIKKFDRALAAMGIQPVKTVNHKFDPTKMRAVETKSAPQYKTGTVIEELSGGFIRGNKVLKFADVIVVK